MMNISVFLAYAAAAVTAGLAVFVASRDQKNPVSRIFAAGMAVLALEAMASALALKAERAGDFLLWYQAHALAASLSQGMWLLFSLTYGRAHYREFLNRWLPCVIAVFAAPTALAVFFWTSWTTGTPMMEQNTGWHLALGWAGYLWLLAVIAGAIMILMNLEQTLWHSTGRKRWQIKFMIIGVGALFGVRIYNSSLAILFNEVGTDALALNAGVLLVADALIARAILRDSEMEVDIYLSHAFLTNSLTIFLIGVYFIGVGLLACLAGVWIGSESLPLIAFLLFVAVIGLGVIFLSGHLRLKRKRLVSRLFDRPLYDYKQVWSRFTETTSSLSNTKDLCNAVAGMVSETLESLSVSIWIVDEGRDALVFGASTTLLEDNAKNMRMTGQAGAELMLALRDQEMPVYFNGTSQEGMHDFSKNQAEALEEARIRYAVPLRAANRIVGILTLSGRSEDAPLTVQDKELLKTIGDQAAANLLNLRLADQLHKAKAMEALQTMSAFFIHDLKNLASKLSLVMENLPVHFDNPNFRQDAIRSVTQSVGKIENMCSKLSFLSQSLEIYPKPASLDQLVTDALKSLDGMFKVPVLCSLGNVNVLHIDGEQIQKVIVNLILNACEAVVGGGQISISTFRDGSWAQLVVSDTGCGMSREFIETRLFKPFQTTKPQGMGIGLFHCKTIVETHGGRIEVESVEGKGTTFRVLLPEKRVAG